MPAIANEVKKRFALEFLTTVIPATPVRTGRARSNWNASLERADLSTRPTDGTSGDKALQRGAGIIRQAKDGQSIFISNNLPYIQVLNAGSSKQAPAGFIERAYDEAKGLLGRIRASALRKALKNGG